MFLQIQGCNWNSGYSKLFACKDPNFRFQYGIQCRIERFAGKFEAYIDTGAEYSIIGGELASELIKNADSLANIDFSTRLGLIKGKLARIQSVLLAESGGGRDLEVEGSFILAPDWNGPIIIGHYCFLEKLNFAFVPAQAATNYSLFLFGGDA
jgi:hypothetical protein